jgi:hypothetical protein
MRFTSCVILNIAAIGAFLMPPLIMAQEPLQSKPDQNPDVTIELLVAETDDAAKQAEKVVKEAGGKINKRSINRDQYDNQTATFSVTIPMQSADDAMEKIRKIGSVRGENSDFDSSVKSVRVRIVISDKRMDSYGDSRSQGRLFAGVAAANLNLNLSNDKTRSLSGAGITLSPRGQWAQLTIIMLKDAKKDSKKSTTTGNSADDEPSSAGSSLFLIGHNFYSSIFGGGYRSYINPYAGLTYGYSRLFNRSLFAIGGTIGLELVKLKWFTWSISGNLMGLYSGKDGGTTNMYATHLFIPF